MFNRQFSRFVWTVLAVAAIGLIAASESFAQTFLPTSGTADWNDDDNWSSPPYPNSPGAAATIPAVSDDLTVNLNESITIGSLDIQKDASGTAVTTIEEGVSGGMLTFDGGTATLAHASSPSPAGTGVTVINAPLSFANGLSVVQNDNTGLQLMRSISGTGDLSIFRVGAGASGGGVVALSGNNSYSGSTLLTGAGGSNFLLVRLNHANAIPGGIGATGGASNLVFTESAVLGLRADDFLRGIGSGADQFQMPENSAPNRAVQSGWAAFIEDRTVNIGGSGAEVSWGAADFNPNILVLGHETADKTITFLNPLNLDSGTGASDVNRNLRTANGSADTDSIVSGGITSTNPNANANMVFWGTANSNPGGTVRLTGVSDYSGTTTLRDGALVVLDHANALAPGNVIIAGGNSVLGLGFDNPTFTRPLGTGDGRINFNGQGGFAAFGGDRVVNLGGNTEQVTWDFGEFVPNGSALALSFDNSDGNLEFQNPINLNNGTRAIAVRDGSAPVDATISAEISGVLALSALNKNLDGTLELTAANTYGGDTTINAGTLLVNNASGSGTGAGNVIVNNTGALGGNGSLTGTVTVNSGGHVAPGTSIGSLGVGGLTLTAGSILDFELGPPGSPGVTSDLVNVTNSGALTIDGGSVVLADAGGLAAGTFTLIDYAGALNGDLANLGTPTGPAGFSYLLVNNVGNTSIDLTVTVAALAGDYNNDGSVDAADYVLWRKDPASHGGDPDGYNDWRANFGAMSAGSGSSTAAVPEPATLGFAALVLSGLSLVGVRPRRP